VCGGCKIVCPTDAILEKEKKIGTMKHGISGQIDFHYALLETAEGGMSPRLVKRVKEYSGEGVNILDSSPGTACPVVETVKGSDLCVLVTDPTPFGINDLKLAVDMARDVGQEPVIIVNRAEYYNDDLKNYCREEALEIIGEIPDERKIAETYSTGDIVVERFPEYKELFEKIASKILKIAGEKRNVIRSSKKTARSDGEKRKTEKTKQQSVSSGQIKPKELVVISGKGGTGKTSIAASFSALSGEVVISDCDVDAADLHLILNPEVRERGYFSGGVSVEIDHNKCAGCGKCQSACQFSAIWSEKVNDRPVFHIDPIACEGCGVCCLVCAYDAIRSEDAVNGEWFISGTRFGPMSHAKLGVAEENSGRLVTLVRDKAAALAGETGRKRELIDGSPGTGCPVIASLSGADYAMIVTEPTVSGIHDMKRILDVTGHFGVRSGIVVNKYDLNKDMTEKIEQMSGEYGVEFLGVVPYDKKVTEAQMKKLSVVEYADCPVSESIKSIWERVSAVLA
jgi:MinD superfamily P-loop ATPase